MSEQFIIDYSNLILKIGIDLTEGDNILIKCPIANYKFGHQITQIAYSLGANNVIVEYIDDIALEQMINHMDKEKIKDIPKWKIEHDAMLAAEQYKVVTLVAPHQDRISIEEGKLSVYRSALIALAGRHRALTNSDEIPWTIAALPNDAWANVVFPGSRNSYEKLEAAVKFATRLEEANPIEKWRNHQQKLTRIASVLNEFKLNSLHLTTSLGTDLHLGLVEGHVWKMAGSNFISNIPTEEVYTMPNINYAEGVVVSSKPLILNNHTYERLTLKFEQGKLINIDGDKEGELKDFFFENAGGRMLGEIALVDRNSMVSKCGVVFHEMLYDENAGAHIALGNSFSSNLKPNDNRSACQIGRNISDIHVDIVFGDQFLNVTAIDNEGNEIQIMEDGIFSI